MLPRKNQRGIIDPLSLFAVGFLVISLIVGTKVVSDRQKSFDIREEAKEILDCYSDSNCASGYKCINGVCKKTSTTTSKTPTPSPYCSSIMQTVCTYGCTPTSSGGKCKSAPSGPVDTSVPKATPTPKPYCSTIMQTVCTYGCTPTSSGGKCKSAPSGPVDTSVPTTTPTPKPYCSSIMQTACTYGCKPTSGGGECKSAPSGPVDTSVPTTTPTPKPYCSSIMQSICTHGCEPTTTGGKCKSAPPEPIDTSIPTATPTPGAYCSSVLQTACTYGCEPTTTGGRCKNAPSEPIDTSVPTPSPTPTPTSPYCSDYYNNFCQYGCEPTTTGGRCKTALASETVPYCSSVISSVCQYGCNPSPSGGTCKTISEVTTDLKPNGEKCELDSECLSGKCEVRNLFGKICINVPTEEEIAQQREEELIDLGRFLNTITLGTFGDYAATYAEINTTQPEASYLERAFSEEGLEASAKLGTVLTAEGALVYFGGTALAGGLQSVPLSSTVIPAVEQASLYSYSYLQSLLATAPSWVSPLIRTGGVLLGNWGVYEGAKDCQEDPGSDGCAMLITGVQMGWVDDLARETGALLDDAGQVIKTAGQQYIDDAQKLYAFDPNARKLMNVESAATAADDIPSVVTLESGETITVGEQIGSAGKQGSAYLGETCTGEACVVKIFEEGNVLWEHVNQAQLDLLQTHATAENIAETGLQLPEFLGTVTGEAGQTVGYAMEYIPGQTAQEIYQTQGGLTYDQATEIFDAVYGFGEATGLPHGDIANPWYEGVLNLGNVIITPEGGVVLIDPAGTALSGITEPFKIESAEFIQEELSTLREWIKNYILE